jgi:uncharacterized protein (DUF362 family)
VECDVLVSIAKMKEHRKAGLSLSLKNMVGMLPPTIYGDAAGYEDPAARSYGALSMLHTGHRQPSATAPPEIDPTTPREFGYRVPRIIADIVRARPVSLAIIDGVETQTTAEGAALDPGDKRQIRLVSPGILVAGLNPACTDAVAAAAMGFDAASDRGQAPFEDCDSMLRVAEEAGIGARDLKKIEIVGAALRDVGFRFRTT